MKVLKRISFLMTAMLLIFSMSVPMVALPLQEVERQELGRQALDRGDLVGVQIGSTAGSIISRDRQGRYSVALEFIEQFGGTHTIFFSDDGYYFVGFYDIVTTRATFVNMQGEVLGYLYTGSEDAFQELVWHLIETVYVVPTDAEAEQFNVRMSHLSSEDMIRQNIVMVNEELSDGMRMALSEVFELDVSEYNYIYADMFSEEVSHFDFFLREETEGTIREVLTSAIDDSPFIACFDIESGRVLVFEMDGTPISYRYVDGEAGFWELVAINREVTSRPVEVRMAELINGGRINDNRNVTEIDVEARLLIEYDEHGNRTETYLGEEFAEMFSSSRVFDGQEYAESMGSGSMAVHYIGIEPAFNERWIMHVPHADHPDPARQRWGRSSLVGGTHHQTVEGVHTRVELWTFNFPHGMPDIDIFITNIIGDCSVVRFNRPRMYELRHNIRFPGERYGAWVSSFDGSFNNVELRFHAFPMVSVRDITYHCWNATGGSLPSNQRDIPVGQWVRLRTNTGNLTRTGYTFDGWTRNSSGSGTHYGAGQDIVMPNNHLQLFASWRRNATGTITIRYHGGGHTSGTIPTQQTLNTPGSINLRPQGTMQRAGYTFGGWRDTNGTIWGAGQLISWSSATSGVVDLTAVWNRIVVPNRTVIFIGNGGNPATYTRFVPQGTAVGNLPLPIWLGQSFVGWYTAQTGGERVRADRTIHNDVRFYARWTAATLFLNPTGDWNVGTSAAASRTVQVNTNVQPWNVSGIHALGLGMDIDSMDIDILSANQASDWITITNPTGNSGGSFVINVRENTTSNARSATVTITAGNTGAQQSGMISPLSGAAITQQIRVSQPAGVTLQDANLSQRLPALFHIRNDSGFVRVQGNGLVRQSGITNLSDVDSTRATDLWAIEPVQGAAGFYTIETLGFRHSDRRSRNMLTAQPEISAQLSFTAYSRGTQNQQWRIQRDSQGNYFITNRAHPHLMIREGNNGIIDLATTSANAGWRFVDYIRTSYYREGFYNPSNISPISVGIGIDISALVSGHLDGALYALGEEWNGISSNMRVSVFGTQELDPLSPNWPRQGYVFSVVVRGRDTIDNPNPFVAGTGGAFLPDGVSIDYIPYEVMEMMERPLRWGTIYINTSTDRLQARTRLCNEALFIHEVGHALKLGHPDERFSGRPRASNWRPVALMNNGSPFSNLENSVGRISGYDRFNLMSAWGR